MEYGIKIHSVNGTLGAQTGFAKHTDAYGVRKIRTFPTKARAEQYADTLRAIDANLVARLPLMGVSITYTVVRLDD